MQYLRKVFILTLILTFYDSLQGKQGIETNTNHRANHVKKDRPPFLRHTDGCRAIGIVWHRMPYNQVVYGIYYHAHLSRSIALRLSGGIAPVKVNYKKHIQWFIAPSFLYTLCAINAHHYIGLSLGPIIEYGSYQAAIFGLPNRNGWDIRVNLGPHYTFYFNQKWTIDIGIGSCIGFFKNKGKSGLLGSLCLQYNL